MKKAGIAIIALVTLAAAGTAGAWYTGTQLEGVLQTNIERANEQLNIQFPDADAALELAGFEQGLFSSQARYRVVLLGEGDNADIDLFVTDDIEHGPMPLSRLVSFKWWPVMAVSHAQLEPSELLNGLFTASAGRPPLTVHSSIGYGKGIHGEIEVAPLNWSKKGRGNVAFSGLSAVYETDTAGDIIKLNGRVDSLGMEGTPSSKGLTSVTLVGLDLSVDRKRDASGLYLGSSKGELDQFAVKIEDRPTLVLSEVLQSDLITLNADGANVKLTYQVGAVNYGADKLGSLGMGWTLSRLQPEAALHLAGLYNSLILGSGTAQVEQLETALEQLLDGHPRLSLDNFSIRTANGESRLSLGMDLDRPVSLESPPAVLLPQLISNLDAKLVLSKPMLKDMVRYKVLFDPEADMAVVEQEASMAAEMVGAMAEMFQLARVEGDNIVSQLSYDKGAVRFNGQSMELEELLGLLTGTP